jgi:hypothetical protein
MSNIDKRLTELESVQVNADLSAMTDEQLSTHLATLEPGSTDWYGVLITSIHRKGSRLPLRNASRLAGQSGNIATHTGSMVITLMEEMLPISHKKERIS